VKKYIEIKQLTDRYFSSLCAHCMIKDGKVSNTCTILVIDIVTDMFNAFLGNDSVNTVDVQQWEMCLSGQLLPRVTRQQRTDEDGGYESRDLFSVWSLCNNGTVFFLCVVRPEAIRIMRITLAGATNNRVWSAVLSLD
jgi:hypothetical protein